MRRLFLFALVFVAALAPSVMAQPGGPGGLGGAGGGPMALGNSYRVTWLPSQPVRGQSTNLGFVQQNLSLSCPVWADGPDTLLVRGGVRTDLFQTDAFLPDSQQPFPDQFWNVSLGVMGMHHFENGWMLGGGLSAGSVSNRPFESFQDLNVNVNAFLRVPAGEQDAWMFSLMYSPLGQLPFPLPGLSYSWNPTPGFSMNLGLPFQLRYCPTDNWSLELSYMLLTVVHARATYRFTDEVSLYGGFDWTNDAYRLNTATVSTNRLLYYEKRLSGGVQACVAEWLRVDLSAGYAFDRFFVEGQLFGDQETNRLDVGAGPYVSGQVQLRW